MRPSHVRAAAGAAGTPTPASRAPESDKYSAFYPPVIKRPHRARALAAKIAHAEAMSTRYLGNYNEEMASGRVQRAEKMLVKSQHWLDVANDLRDGASSPLQLCAASKLDRLPLN